MGTIGNTTLLGVLLLAGPTFATVLLLLRTSAARLVVPLACGVQLLASYALFIRSQGSTIALSIGEWPAPLGIAVRADNWSGLMVLTSAVVATACAGWSLAHRSATTAHRMYWPLFLFLWSALTITWLSADLFNLYVGLELLGLSAVGLVATGDRADALSAALRYLIAALLGSLGYLLGVALLYGMYGTLDLEMLATTAQGTRTTVLALSLMTAGLCLKTALFPLHGWLPPAHGVAEPPVSAMLSALVIKASFLLLARIWLVMLPGALTPAVAAALGTAGAMAVAYGGWQALREPSLKMLVAHSTVAQIGYLFLVFPLVVTTDVDAKSIATSGMLVQVVAHAVAKAGMFLAAGAMIAQTGKYEVAALAGMHRKNPVALFAFGLCGVSLMGLPPSGGFVAKWLMLQAALRTDRWPWAVVLLGGGMLTAAYVFRVFRTSFLQASKGAGDHDVSERQPRLVSWVPFALGVVAIALGVGLAGQLP